MFADGDLVTPDVLRGFGIDQPAVSADEAGPGLGAIARSILRMPVENKLQAVEDALIAEAMALSEGNQTAAARLLGVHRKAVGRRIDDRDKSSADKTGQR